MYKILLVIAIIFHAQFSHSQINFESYHTLYLNYDGEVVCIEDVNNDGRNDVIVGTEFNFVDSTDYRVIVYLQDSLGNLNNGIISDTKFLGLKTMDVCDVNNDSFNDIIIGYQDSIGIIYMNDLGNLDDVAFFYSADGVNGLKCGDFNNDSLQDIVVSHSYDSTLTLFYQNAMGFNIEFINAAYASNSEIEVGDLNNDGLTDIAYMTELFWAGGVNIYLQDIDGNMVYESTYLSELTFSGIDVGDLNSDGKDDIVLTDHYNYPSSQIYVLFQDTLNSSFETEIELSAYYNPQPVEIADLDCNGSNEIVVVHGAYGSTTTYAQGDTSSFENYIEISTFPYFQYDPQGFSIGDINSDNRVDIVIAGDLGAMVFYNNSAPTDFESIVYLSTGLDSIYVDDHIDSSNVEIISVDYIPEYVIEQTDSFLVINNYHLDSVRVDSFFVRTGEMCSSLYIDTIPHSYFLVNESVISDTILVSRTIDTILIEQESLDDIVVYPNPSEEYIIVSLKEVKADIKVVIFNSLGQIVLKEEYKSKYYLYFDLKLQAGVYILQMEFTSGATKAIKFIRR